MKEIARFYDPHEAQVAAGFLRAQGFDVEVADYNTLTAQPELRFGLGGFRLMAAQRDAYMAEKTLAETRRKPAFSPCPNCGSERVRRRRAWQVPFFMLPLFGLVPFAPATDQLRCNSCGHTWKDADDESQNDV
ncbi:MAG: hypothetical protein AAGH41_03820 [Pseudomonadota bacterium]